MTQERRFASSMVVRYASGSTALAQLLAPHGVGGWHAEQFYGGIVFISTTGWPGIMAKLATPEERHSFLREKQKRKKLDGVGPDRDPVSGLAVPDEQLIKEQQDNADGMIVSVIASLGC